jgi:hypothetical protein
MKAEEKAAELWPDVNAYGYAFNRRNAFVKGANWQASQHEWVACSERKPLYKDELGNTQSQKCIFYAGKTVYLGYYFPKHFARCEWENLDEDDYESYHVDLFREDFWLAEGWWSEFEDELTGESVQAFIKGVTHWMPLPSPPKTEI